MTMPSYFSPPEVARLFGVNPGKVLGFIRSGELPAVNVAASLTGRPRWRISPSDLAIFEQRRSAGKPPPVRRRRRRDEHIIEFF